MLLGMLACGAQACVEEEAPAQPEAWEDPAYQLRAQSLTSMCRVNVQGKGFVDTETDYLPRVIACENGNAPFEALKAQAIAARTYAKFKMDVERVAVPDSQAGQVYTCNRQPSAEHFRAVSETAGQVLTYNNSIIAAFYVSGVMPSTSSCVPTTQDKARASSIDRTVEAYVTYNAGRSGSRVIPAPRPIGHPDNPANRGVMSQNGGSCLSNQGRPAAGILRFYYGDDIRVTDLPGSCGEDTGDQPVTPGPSDPNANDSSTCRDTSAEPAIIRRSAWGANPPRSNSGSHTPNRLTIHHTTGPNKIYGPLGVKSIQTFHQRDRGWSDIGYHFLVDQDGKIYEGRPERTIGAHVANQNSGNLGISLMGDFSSGKGDPTDAQFKATAHLIKHLTKKYNIQVNRTLIKGHGERMATDCPGHNVLKRFDELLRLGQAETLCEEQGGDRPEEPEYEYKGPQVTLDQNSYKYLRYSNRADAGGVIELDGVEISKASKSYPVKGVASSVGTTNAQAAASLPDVTACGGRSSKIATIQPGGHIVFELPPEIFGAEFVYFSPGRGGFKGAPALPDSCEEAYTAYDGYGVIEYSYDGQTWLKHNEMENYAPPVTAGVEGAAIKITSPDATMVPRQTTFKSKGSPEIVRVEYYAEQWRLGQSSDAMGEFPLSYRFNGPGKRLITAIGYNQANKPIATDERYYTVGDGIAFITPKDGGTYGPALVFQVTAGEGVARVEYSADGNNPIGTGTDKASNFRVEQTLVNMGQREITAKAYDAAGMLVDEVKIKITVGNGTNFRFAYPNNGGSYKPMVRFLMEVSRPDVTRVVYLANPAFKIGESSDRNGQFPNTYTFNQFGRRTITAQGFNAQGQKVAEAQIQILVTDQSGAVPGGSMNDPAPVADPPPTTNSASADSLAREAYKLYSSRRGSRRRADGSGMGSAGLCWHYVYEALVRWGISESEYNRLANVGPCSASGFGNSAYCVGRNAAANPQTLQSAWGMTKLNVAPSAAPRGAMITWDRGCNGFHAVHGHIEIAQGDGTACSDYCGRIRAGNPSCANVFVPSN
jgi:hypothetical protein